MKVPVSGKVITAEDKMKMIEAVTDGWFTEGRFCKEFGDKLKKYIGVRHCSLVNSGSSANLLALTAIKDLFYVDLFHNQVATCATAFPTTVAPIIQNNLIPYFIDVNPKTLNPDTVSILEALSKPEVIGVILAHTLGFPYDAKAVREYCDEHGKFFIEDCCDALGAEIYGKKVGSFGHASTYSFFPAHHITTGEGGAVLTDDGRLHRQIEVYRDWGRSCWCLPGHDNTCGKRFEHKWKNLPDGYDHKYTYIKFGYNMKMTEMQAALGSSQMDRIDEFHNIRIKNWLYLWYIHLSEYWSGYIRSFEGYEDNAKDDKFSVSPFGLPITVTTDKFTRKELTDFLEENGIATRPVFAGNITRQPLFDDVYYEKHSDLSGSDYVMERTFWIGCWHGLTQEHLDYVILKFDEFFKMKGLK